jgi:hypothetical protein
MGTKNYFKRAVENVIEFPIHLVQPIKATAQQTAKWPVGPAFHFVNNGRKQPNNRNYASSI